jgi:hypothetical protein
MSNIAPPYNPYTQWTDGCTTVECLQALSAPSSLEQGQTFARMTARLHGGRRGRKGRKGRKSRRGGGPALYPSQFSEMLPEAYQMRAAAQLGPVIDPTQNKFSPSYSGGSRKYRGKNRNMRGGAVDYPSQFSEQLPQDLVPLSRTGILDQSNAELAQFVGKYGLTQSGGSRGRKSRRNRKHRGLKHRGGVAPVDSPGMILPANMESAAYLNPQWYNENLVVPSFKGPENSYAQQAYENQIAYKNHNPAAIPVPPPAAMTGGRRLRKSRRSNRKSRRSNRKSRRSNRKSRR